MNGPHDLGGVEGHGPVIPEVDEPYFHAEWEKSAMALTVAMGMTGLWNLDQSRHARECLSAEFYLNTSYYHIWLAALQNLMLERGAVTQEELGSGKMELSPIETKRIVMAADIPAVLAAGGPVDRDTDSKPKFAPGDRVLTAEIQNQGHTRLPAYAQEKVGYVERVQGFHVFPDANAKEQDELPHWLYAVAFQAVDLFGEKAERGNIVMVDCWEPYLSHEE